MSSSVSVCTPVPHHYASLPVVFSSEHYLKDTDVDAALGRPKQRRPSTCLGHHNHGQMCNGETGNRESEMERWKKRQSCGVPTLCREWKWRLKSTQIRGSHNEVLA